MLRNLALALAAVATTLGVLELSCRALGFGFRRTVAHYIVEWKKDWGGDFVVFKPQAGINQDGMRDREHAVENPAGRRRIAVLGDSVAFGWGVAPIQSFPSKLEALLTAGGDAVEVFNLAIPGWTTRQERVAYERVARRYRPDQVLVAFCLNDVAEMQNNLSRPPAAFAFVYEHSALIRSLLAAQRWEILQVEELFAHPATPRVERGWQLVFSELLALRDAASRDGAQFALVVFPFRFQVIDDAPEPLAQRRLAAFAEQNDIRHFDALPVLLPLGRSGFFDYDHLSARGLEHVARAVVDSGVLAP